MSGLLATITETLWTVAVWCVASLVLLTQFLTDLLLSGLKVVLVDPKWPYLDPVVTSFLAAYNERPIESSITLAVYVLLVAGLLRWLRNAFRNMRAWWSLSPQERDAIRTEQRAIKDQQRANAAMRQPVHHQPDELAIAQQEATDAYFDDFYYYKWKEESDSYYEKRK